MKVTVAFRDDELYRSVRLCALAEGRQIRDIVEEALRRWLEERENAEDERAADEAIGDYDTHGGVDAEEFFRRMVAEGRVAYETDE